MKAFEVIYDIGGSSGNRVVVLVKDEADLETALTEKTEYDNSRWSRIVHKKEIPLTRVMVKDLSITELLVWQRVVITD
ncbi:hypothetical protein PQE74_gp090 [Bacillus phage vB_BanS_Chewbecca]|uniref:Uncharacterized protein n=2 Tax=Tsamsavirus TaxID=3044849 RepID=A0AAE8YYT4_9CAUD|nr:hypothetical protein PQE72_gp116 [Bacillus phage vB_BanS_Skywalker]YP_010681233.1 hypothetical protein PQE74_gp090 [Bacillus phage vB_BanS_Chewbecca]UGO46173.1 hypothetical protein CHEWBECCA_90 [Bacillus phage vB_BanS_Chewbecca]UGO51327.1 hypothetical protein SKYWALKER_170 [Bacillus phage vB_BanS_Skywalker]